ncbi:Kinesin-3 [Dactylellina cionopaga]|nr:Kinesin-3 [Dactylellina cionopaga]
MKAAFNAAKLSAGVALASLSNNNINSIISASPAATTAADKDFHTPTSSRLLSPSLQRVRLAPVSPSELVRRRYTNTPPLFTPKDPNKDNNGNSNTNTNSPNHNNTNSVAFSFRSLIPLPASRLGVNEAYQPTEPDNEPQISVDMHSSLPRPGGSRLPAPASSSSIPPPQQQPLTDLGESTVNSRIGIFSASTIGKPSALKAPAPARAIATNTLKRPLENPESAHERPAQIARSAISQTGPAAAIKAATAVRPLGKSAAGIKSGFAGSSRIGAAAAKSALGRSQTGAAMRGKQNFGVPAAAAAPSPKEAVPEEEEEESSSSAPLAPKKREKRAGWDVKGRLADLEEDHREMMARLADTSEQKDMSSMKVIELETIRATLETKNSHLQADLSRDQAELNKCRMELLEEQRLRRVEADDARRQLLNETDELRRKARDDVDNLERKNKSEVNDLTTKHKFEVDELRMALEKLKMELADDKRRHADELSSVKSNASRDLEDAQQRSRNEMMELKNRNELEMSTMQSKYQAEIATLRNTSDTELGSVKAALKVETAAHNETKDELAIAQKMNKDMRGTISEQSVNSLNMESTARALRDKICSLESMIADRDSSIRLRDGDVTDMRKNLEIAMAKLRTEETLRRKLHNQVLELKGNIRVFCRVRPTLEAETEPAKIDFPDEEEEAKDIKLYSMEKSTMGIEAVKEHPFTFDKVFNPTCDNNVIFEEISQLVQSALDGYNVCIFAYGQTGSGKTFTMTSKDGMIPQAVDQIFRTSAQLTEKGWEYTMEGSFVEVYNENLNDLLGKDTDLDKKKIEVRHDKGRTMLTECTTIPLNGPDMMEEVMRRASNNRMVAATKANERSSRSHSVFILKLAGVNKMTGEKCEGTLNLVDLAGSERLSHSQATGDRLKETQNINKSLSALGDVISALGGGKEVKHIPYRNSKLTYLLQNSLGGNSKTLMFVMVSPLHAHMNETLTSLKFAKKVSQVNIGTAKKVKVENSSP